MALTYLTNMCRKLRTVLAVTGLCLLLNCIVAIANVPRLWGTSEIEIAKRSFVLAAEGISVTGNSDVEEGDVAWGYFRKVLRGYDGRVGVCAEDRGIGSEVLLGSVHFDFISQGSVFLFKLIEGRSHKSYQLGPASLVVSPRLKTEQQDISSVLPCWGSTDVLKRNIGLNILVRSKPIARELRNLGNYIGSLINFKRPLLILKSGIRSIGSTFGGSSRLLYFGVLLDNFS